MAASAVLFDLDGVLIDSEPVWTIAESELAARLGGTWSTELKAAIVGTRLDVSVPTILRWYGRSPTEVAVAEASTWLLARMVELFHQRLSVDPAVLRLVDRVRAANVPVGLVSSSLRVLVDAALDRLGRHRFDVTVAGDEVRHGKPDPECYQLACARLGVPADRTVVVEDAPAGVVAAEAAGCIAVAIPTIAHIAPTARRPVLTSIGALDAEWLLALPERLTTTDG